MDTPHLLTLIGLSKRDILKLLNRADRFKRERRIHTKLLSGRSLALLFQKVSTRTRVSFDVAIHELGGYSIFLNESDIHLSRGERIEDTAKTLSKYVDFIVARVYSHDQVERLATASEVPVINALSNTHHPCQALSDLQTIREEKGALDSVKIAWIGDSTNVCNELMIGAAKVGADFALASPADFRPPKAILMSALADAEKSGSKLTITTDPLKAVTGADVIATDSFVSMGTEKGRARRLMAFIPRYQVTANLIESGRDAIFMHCLPAKRGEEITDGVLDHPSSRVWQQVENKIHMHKAILLELFKK